MSNPPTMVAVVNPRGLPTTMNCSVSWKASSLRESESQRESRRSRNNSRQGMQRKCNAPSRGEDDRPNTEWIAGYPLDNRERKRHGLSATRLCAADAVSAWMHQLASLCYEL
jgi:hypothetical protein